MKNQTPSLLNPSDRIAVSKEVVARKNQDGTVILMKLDESTSFFKLDGLCAEAWRTLETPRALSDLLAATPAAEQAALQAFLQDALSRGLARVTSDAPAGAESPLAKFSSPLLGALREFNLEQIETEVLNESVYLDVFAGSDFRLKKNIRPIQGALDKIAGIQGVTFEWDQARYPAAWPGPSSAAQAGLIAQEVAAVMPELVRQDQGSGYLTMDYTKLTSYLVEAVKELSERVRALESQSK